MHGPKEILHRADLLNTLIPLLQQVSISNSIFPGWDSFLQGAKIPSCCMCCPTSWPQAYSSRRKEGPTAVWMPLTNCLQPSSSLRISGNYQGEFHYSCGRIGSGFPPLPIAVFGASHTPCSLLCVQPSPFLSCIQDLPFRDMVPNKCSHFSPGPHPDTQLAFLLGWLWPSPPVMIILIVTLTSRIFQKTDIRLLYGFLSFYIGLTYPH